MDTIQKKHKIYDVVKKTLQRDYMHENSTFAKSLRSLLEDIENDFFVVVVVGEFKRGKSTFINALLKEDVLPTDVLPETAVVSVVAFNDEPCVDVIFNDGNSQKGDLTKDFLSKFSVRSNNRSLNKIKYIKIGYPADMLINNLVIVDTPGVDDLDNQRCEVTYGFIPKANAVLFLLDSNSPLKRSEKEFIENRLFPLGINNIIFVANKYDTVDEEEDEDYIDVLRNRLINAFENTTLTTTSEIKVYPLSAKWAMQGYKLKNYRYVEASGITDIEKTIKDIAINGSVERNKIYNFFNRYKQIMLGMKNELERQKSIKKVDKNELDKAKLELKNIISEHEKYRANIARFVEHEKPDILAIVDKSINHFSSKLEQDIIDNIQFYKGLDFKEYVEQRISKMLKKEFECWIALNSANISRLFKVLEIEIGRGLSENFKQRVALRTNSLEVTEEKYLFNLTAEDVSGATINAGIISASGAGLMMLLGTPVLMPFISMAAFPLLQKHLLENKLSEAKVKIIPNVQDQIVLAVDRLRVAIHRYVEEQCNVIVRHGEEVFNFILQDIKLKVENEITNKSDEEKSIIIQINELDDWIQDINSMLQEVSL